MHQRIAMHAFERRSDRESLRPGNAEQRRALDHQKRAKALAGPEARVAHRLEQALRPAELMLDRLCSQQLIEQTVGVLRDLVEVILKSSNSVHACFHP